MAVLIVEDQWAIAAEMEDQVSAMGFDVMGPAPDLAGAFALLREEWPEMALLEVSLDTDVSFPVADALLAHRVPFAFVTAFRQEELPEPYRDCPHLRKPFTPVALRSLVMALRGKAPSSLRSTAPAFRASPPAAHRPG